MQAILVDFSENIKFIMNLNNHIVIYILNMKRIFPNCNSYTASIHLILSTPNSTLKFEAYFMLGCQSSHDYVFIKGYKL